MAKGGTYTDPNGFQKYTRGAAHFTGPVGVTINGGIPVADVYQPSRDTFIDWFFGADDAYQTLTVNTWNAGLWVEISQINVDHRALVIIGEAASPSFHYRLSLSRNGAGADAYEIIADTTIATTRVVRAVLASSLGYDLYAKLDVNPDTGQTGTQLNFKAYLVGRGG